MKYIAGLVRVLKELDVTIYEGTHINDIRQEDKETWILQTDQNYSILADKLIVATNTPVNNRFYKKKL
jgi:glycine/D-amino acid oxidase-like deaminating enzyme